MSDGKPTDYDRYEGRYGVADVRQAVHEAQQRSVHLFALAVDAEARFYLPRMFGGPLRHPALAGAPRRRDGARLPDAAALTLQGGRDASAASPRNREERAALAVDFHRGRAAFRRSSLK